jgi:hypothetical protein
VRERYHAEAAFFLLMIPPAAPPATAEHSAECMKNLSCLPSIFAHKSGARHDDARSRMVCCPDSPARENRSGGAREG